MLLLYFCVSVVKTGTNETLSSTSPVERHEDTSSTTFHYKLRQDDVTLITSSGAEVTTASPNTSYLLDVLVQDTGDVRTLQVPDPGERWHHASRPQHRLGVERQQTGKQHLEKTRSAVVVISSVFFTLTLISTFALGIFFRKRNTVFVLQKCEQRDYAAAAAADDDDEEEEEELSTDYDSTTSQTVVSQTEVDRRTSQRRRRDLHRARTAPMTPDLSLFCTSQTAKRNRTGSGSMRRDKMSRRAVYEMGSSWVELGPATTLSTALPVECTDDDTDDDVKYRVTRDVMSAGSLLRCDVTSTSGLYDVDGRSRFHRSTSLDADVCRFALTRGAASSQPLTLYKDVVTTPPRQRDEELHDSRQSMTSNCTVPRPRHEINTGDGIDTADAFEQLEPSTMSTSTSDHISYPDDGTRKEPTT